MKNNETVIEELKVERLELLKNIEKMNYLMSEVYEGNVMINANHFILLQAQQYSMGKYEEILFDRIDLLSQGDIEPFLKKEGLAKLYEVFESKK